MLLIAILAYNFVFRSTKTVVETLDYSIVSIWSCQGGIHATLCAYTVLGFCSSSLARPSRLAGWAQCRRKEGLERVQIGTIAAKKSQ